MTAIRNRDSEALRFFALGMIGGVALFCLLAIVAAYCFPASLTTIVNAIRAAR